MKKILLTGSNGRIGQVISSGLRTRYQIRGFDQQPSPGLEDFVVADLADLAALRAAARGMDAIIHLAAKAGNQSSWQAVLGANIVGTYHVFEAARLEGVKRLVFASTNQVTNGYGPVAVRWSDLPRPTSY